MMWKGESVTLLGHQTQASTDTMAEEFAKFKRFEYRTLATHTVVQGEIEAFVMFVIQGSRKKSGSPLP